MLNKCKYFRNFVNYTSIRRITTEADIDTRLFLRQPLDPLAVELTKKHESSIIYSSYVENNKMPLKYRERMIRMQIAEKQKSRLRLHGAGKPFSLALKYIDKRQLPQTDPNGMTNADEESAEEPDSEHEKVMKEVRALDHGEFRRYSNNIIMNESKMEILRELKARRRKMEEEQEYKYPPNWMEDYETYDESMKDEDLADDLEFGTPGIFWPSNTFRIDFSDGFCFRS